jgi:CBS-domain-containing membrane protein
MVNKYNIVEIFTSEEVRWKGQPVWDAIVNHVRKTGIAARCIVTRGLAGCYENGEISSNTIESISVNLPLKIEVICPTAELGVILPGIEEMVMDGIVLVEDMDVCSHRTQKRLIPRQLRVKDVMSSSPSTVREDSSLGEVVKLLMNHEFNAVPVVNKANCPIGIITQSDLINRANMPIRIGLLNQFEPELLQEYLSSISHLTVKEVMTQPIKTIQVNQRLTEAVDLMLANHLKRLPVVGINGEITGVLARSDIFNIIAKLSPDWQAIKAHQVFVGNITTVRDIMARDTETVLPDTPIEAVLQIMADKGIQRVAVVDDKKKFIGLIFDADLIGLFAEHKSAIRDYFMGKIPFSNMVKKHRELYESSKIKKAADILKTDILTVNENTRTEDAIKLMAEKKIKRLPVIDEQGVFKGMINRDSLLRIGTRIKKR